MYDNTNIVPGFFTLYMHYMQQKITSTFAQIGYEDPLYIAIHLVYQVFPVNQYPTSISCTLRNFPSK